MVELVGKVNWIDRDFLVAKDEDGYYICSDLSQLEDPKIKMRAKIERMIGKVAFLPSGSILLREYTAESKNTIRELKKVFKDEDPKLVKLAEMGEDREVFRDVKRVIEIVDITKMIRKRRPTLSRDQYRLILCEKLNGEKKIILEASSACVDDVFIERIEIPELIYLACIAIKELKLL